MATLSLKNRLEVKFPLKPVQIKKNPTKEKTRAFIHRIRQLRFEFNQEELDIYKLNTDLEIFCTKNLISPKQVFDIELVLEEFLQNILFPQISKKEKVILSLNYYSEEHGFEINCLYSSDRKFDVKDCENDFALTILKKR